MNLNNLPVMGCHSCSRQLSLSEATVQDNHVVDGKFVCSCGQQYSIESGIVRAPRDSMPPGRDYGKYLSDYISLEKAPFVDSISRGLEWLHSQMDFPSLNGRVLLELGTGIGFFLRYIYKDLPADCLYIAVDHNLEKLKFLKDSLEMAGCRKNILFICADFLHIPIQTRCADVLLDLMGSTSYCLTTQVLCCRRRTAMLKTNQVFTLAMWSLGISPTMASLPKSAAGTLHCQGFKILLRPWVTGGLQKKSWIP
ncbi:MAG: class I SAM-dependent methyltransferase [Firmicutes bacterium]|nr:class I SAM-dependent methyltransferase [Bacillota bacterium]